MFANLDFQAAQIIDNTIPNDKYAAIVATAETKKTEKGKTGFNLAFSIVMGKYAGRQIFDWSEVPSESTEGYTIKTGARAGTTVSRDENMLTLADRLKTKLHGLGIPEDRMATVTPDDLIGRKVYITVRQDKNNSEQSRVVKLEPASFSDSDVQIADASPVAKNPFL
jgi:hypothetical protein